MAGRCRPEMENRRKDYRYHFPHPAGLRAELASQGRVPFRASGEIMDLSVAGAGLRLPGDLPKILDGSWLVRLSLPGERPLSLNAALVHRVAQNSTLGFRFLPLVDPVAQQRRERVIWRFLLDEQRKMRNGSVVRSP
jgi:c-di-GMP-binding flagellar brake protein YcgR